MIDTNNFERDVSTDKIDFNDKVAIVTGAGAGLGKSYAFELSKRGAKVVVNDFGCKLDGSNGGSILAADEVVSAINAAGGQAVANYDSVASVNGGLNIVRTALDAFGTVDILINNAGILRDKSFVKMELADWQAIIDVHLNGAYNVTSPSFKIMKDKGYGRIIMTTSAAGLYGNFGQTNYASAKMGLVGMMNSLKLEGEKYNIKINSIAPMSASRLTKNLMPEEMFNKAKPDLVAALVLYLCSDDCGDSGGLYNVGMGYVNRVALVTNGWTKVCNHDFTCFPEDIHKLWKKINSMNETKEFNNLGYMVLDFLDYLKD